MRTASPAFTTHIDGECTTLCRLLTIVRTDGTTLRFTDNARDVVFGGNVYQSGYSFTCSAISIGLDISVSQSVTLTVIMDDDGFREEDLLARRFDGAIAEIVVVNYENPDTGYLRYVKAVFGNIKLTDKLRATIEMTPISDGVTSNGSTLPNKIYQRTCRAVFGDAECTFDIDSTAVDFTVDAADGLNIQSSALSQPENHWAWGYIEWLTGDNVGLKSPVRTSNVGVVNIFIAANGGPVVAGDTGRIRKGCDKTYTNCLAYSNTDNFRGEPDIPNNVTIRYDGTRGIAAG